MGELELTLVLGIFQPEIFSVPRSGIRGRAGLQPGVSGKDERVLALESKFKKK
jgi:hypothetical protein